MPALSTRCSILLALLILVGFAVRNLPWHLDDYDQAKQAFVSFELVEDGRIFFQHTPEGKVATKPPLAGWISAALYAVSRSWDLAWHAPSLIAGLVLMVLMWREGGWLAAAAFGLNPFSQRLATLVRTDMMLALWLFLAGLLLMRKITDGGVWTTRQRWCFALVVLASMLTKGPILFAFLLPGYVAFLFLQRRRETWRDAAMWLLPLIPFAAWLVAGVYTFDQFYEQVVGREFLARFDGGENAVHNAKPLYTYLTKIVPMFAPWSLALYALPFIPAVRRQIKASPELMWLVCWVLGGLIVMSLVPSKRADRIFPIIPPACLLLANALPLFPRARLLIPSIAVVAVVVNLAYSGWNCFESYRSNQDGLVAFGEQSCNLARNLGTPLAIVRPRDEGMLLYARQTSFINPAAARNLWRNGDLRAAILPMDEWNASQASYPGAHVLVTSPDIPDKFSRYVFIAAQK